ncbi:hypothetical protein AVEN_187443-1 [Araneus ventricosus]|uniref:DUF4817 domain-containing protein n=1 Tax=Araneus ventricosus TaxID=182803 RepID=A0A4Y2BSJ5_ARAVE|nr:hypothetical protein AVEN_187443-1 [Araneus ventricosus]
MPETSSHYHIKRYLNGESPTVALRHFLMAKGLKKKKEFISCPGILTIVQSILETGRFEQRSQNDRPSFTGGRDTAILVNEGFSNEH